MIYRFFDSLLFICDYKFYFKFLVEREEGNGVKRKRDNIRIGKGSMLF